MKSIEVDYTSIENLTTALKASEAHAVVSTIPLPALTAQTNLIHAAANAGVSRFIPSEFGADLHNPLNRAAPPYKLKVEGEDLLEKLADEGKLGYTVLYNGAFLD